MSCWQMNVALHAVFFRAVWSVIRLDTNASPRWSLVCSTRKSCRVASFFLLLGLALGFNSSGAAVMLLTTAKKMAVVVYSIALPRVRMCTRE